MNVPSLTGDHYSPCNKPGFEVGASLGCRLGVTTTRRQAGMVSHSRALPKVYPMARRLEHLETREFIVEEVGLQDWKVYSTTVIRDLMMYIYIYMFLYIYIHGISVLQFQ